MLKPTSITTGRTYLRYLLQQDLPGQSVDALGDGESQVPYQVYGDLWDHWGIANQPTVAQLRNLFGGNGPDGEDLIRNRKDRRAGTDFTISWDKSISGVYALAPAELKARIDRADRIATRKMLDRLHTMVTVRSPNREKSAGFAAVEFRHSDSREGDPNEHKHVVYLNFGLSIGGKYHCTDVAEAVRRQKELGALYRTEFAHGLQQIGFQIERVPDKHGDDVIRLAGFPEPLRQFWSARSAQMEAKLHDWQTHTARATRAAALMTRQDKVAQYPAAKLEMCGHQAAEHGWTEETLQQMLHMPRQAYEIDRDAIIQRLASRKPDFTQLDINHAVAVAMQGAAGADRFDAMRDQVMSSPDLVRVLKPEQKAAVYTTAQNQVAGIELKAAVRALQEQGRVIAPGKADQAIQAAELAQRDKERDRKWGKGREPFSFTGDTRQAVAAALTSKTSISIISGVQGQEKDAVMEAVVRAKRSEGLRLIGIGAFGRGAAGLAKAAGLPSQTLDGVLAALDDPKTPIRRGDLVLLDKAATTNIQATLRVLEAAKRRGAHVVVTGLRVGGAGVAYRAIWHELAVDKQIKRSQAKHETALRQKAGGNAAIHALGKFQQHRRLHEGTGDASQQALAFWKSASDRGVKRPLMVCKDQAAAVELNTRARAAASLDKARQYRLTTCDALNRPVGQRDFAVGDRVMAGRTNPRVGLQKHEGATIIEIDKIGQETCIRLQKDNGKKVEFLAREYANLDHGYAVPIERLAKMADESKIGNGVLVLANTDPKLQDVEQLQRLAEKHRFAGRAHVILSDTALIQAERNLGIDNLAESWSGRVKSVLNAAEDRTVERLAVGHEIDTSWQNERARMTPGDQALADKRLAEIREAEVRERHRLEDEHQRQLQQQHQASPAQTQSQSRSVRMAH